MKTDVIRMSGSMDQGLGDGVTTERGESYRKKGLLMIDAGSGDPVEGVSDGEQV